MIPPKLNMFTGILFSFNEEGEYIHESLYLPVYIVPLYYIIVCLLGPVMQMLWFPDYQLLVKTLAELDDLRKNLRKKSKNGQKKRKTEGWERRSRRFAGKPKKEGERSFIRSARI